MEIKSEDRLKNIGLDQTQIKNILKGKTTLINLLKTLDCAKVITCEKKVDNNYSMQVGNLLYTVSTRLPQSIDHHREYLCLQIINNNIINNIQLEAAIEYLEKKSFGSVIDQKEFETSSGVGVIKIIIKILRFLTRKNR